MGSPQNLTFIFNIFATAEMAMAVANKRHYIEQVDQLWQRDASCFY